MSHVPWNFRSTWLTVCHRLSIVFPVFIVFIVGFAPTMRSAQCAPPTTPPRGHALQKYKNTWHSVCPVPPCPFCPFCPSCPFSLPAVSAPRKALCQPIKKAPCQHTGLFQNQKYHTRRQEYGVSRTDCRRAGVSPKMTRSPAAMPQGPEPRGREVVIFRGFP